MVVLVHAPLSLQCVCECVCVGGGQEGVQDRGTDVCCIVVVCMDGRGPGAAFVSLAFKSTRLHSVVSCLPSSPLLSPPHLPPPFSSSWREGRDVCGGGGCLGLVEEAPAVPSAPPPPHPPTGDCWRSQLASSWPIRSIWHRRRRRRREKCPSVAWVQRGQLQ